MTELAITASRPNRKERLSIRRILRKRDGDNCHWCGGLMIFGLPFAPDMPIIGHKVARWRGGSYQLNNLFLAHRICDQIENAKEQTLPDGVVIKEG